MRNHNQKQLPPNNTYLNHQLNKSPTKTSYTFGKIQRFGNHNDPKIEKSSGSNTPSIGASRATITSSERSGRNVPYKSPKLQKKMTEQTKLEDQKLQSKSSRKRWEQPTISSRNKSKSRSRSRSNSHTSKKSSQKKQKKQQLETVVDYKDLGQSNATKKTFGSIKTSNSRGRNHHRGNVQQIQKTYQKTKTIAYTFSKQPRSKQNSKQDQVGPGMYEDFSQFGKKQ